MPIEPNKIESVTSDTSVENELTTPDTINQIVQEVDNKINDYETSMEPFFQEANEYANQYRLIPKQKRKRGLTRTVVSETTRSVETLATIWYKQQTAESPNFQLFPSSNLTRPGDLFAHTALIQEQMIEKEYNEKALPGLRSLALFGSIFIEEPFIKSPNEAIKYTDFRTKSILEVAHDRSVKNINEANWICSLNWITASTLRRIVSNDDTGVFDERALMEVLSESQNRESIPTRVIVRLQDAGYTGLEYKNLFELAVYQGILDCNNDYKDMVVWVINRSKVIAVYENPFPNRRKMTRYVGFIHFDIEPQAYGIGKLTRRLQKDLNFIRETNQDLTIFNLLPMLKVARSANLNYEDLQALPLSVIELDNVNSLDALSFNPEAIRWGMALEKEMKEEFRATSGAVDNLQAIVTEATATETTMATNEAFRRVSSYGEVIASGMLGKHINACINDNQKWISEPIWVHNTGKSPAEVLPENVRKPVKARMRIITDKDFRPKRLQRIIEMLQMYSSIRNTFPQEVIGRIDPLIFFEEAALMLQIDPDRLIKQAASPSPMDMGRLMALQGAMTGPKGNPGFAASPVGEIPAGVPANEI